MAAKRSRGALPPNARGPQKELEAYQFEFAWYQRDSEEYAAGKSRRSPVEHLEVCLDYAGKLGEYAGTLGLHDQGEFWHEEEARYGTELHVERQKQKPAPREMKALRFDPVLYSETKTIAIELMKTTLTAYIEDAMRQKNESVLNEPAMRRQFESRRKFDVEQRGAGPSD